MINWDNARKVKKLTNSSEPVILYYIDGKGYVLSNGYNTEWLNEYGTFINGSSFSIEGTLGLTAKQLEQLEKSYLFDKQRQSEKMTEDEKKYIQREFDKVWLDGDIEIKVASENNETKWISLDNTKLNKILKAITN